jgi:hypothetical protein
MAGENEILDRVPDTRSIRRKLADTLLTADHLRQLLKVAEKLEKSRGRTANLNFSAEPKGGRPNG